VRGLADHGPHDPQGLPSLARCPPPSWSRLKGRRARPRLRSRRSRRRSSAQRIAHRKQPSFSYRTYDNFDRMPCSGVRGCTGTFPSALHSLVRWTPAHELLQASAAETRPIPESIQSIGGFEHAGIRAATLSAGIHEKFGHFASPFLFGAPGSGAPRFRHDTGRALQTERHSTNHAPAVGARGLW
jgi:hypothetical protein